MLAPHSEALCMYYLCVFVLCAHSWMFLCCALDAIVKWMPIVPFVYQLARSVYVCSTTAKNCVCSKRDSGGAFYILHWPLPSRSSPLPSPSPLATTRHHHHSAHVFYSFGWMDFIVSLYESITECNNSIFSLCVSVVAIVPIQSHKFCS